MPPPGYPPCSCLWLSQVNLGLDSPIQSYISDFRHWEFLILFLFSFLDQYYSALDPFVISLHTNELPTC